MFYWAAQEGFNPVGVCSSIQCRKGVLVVSGPHPQKIPDFHGRQIFGNPGGELFGEKGDHLVTHGKTAFVRCQPYSSRGPAFADGENMLLVAGKIGRKIPLCHGLSAPYQQDAVQIPALFRAGVQERQYSCGIDPGFRWGNRLKMMVCVEHKNPSF